MSRYEDILGCGNVSLSNTTNYYARYTTSFLCNGIVQNSKTPCNLTDADSQPLCADSCVSFAMSNARVWDTDAG